MNNIIFPQVYPVTAHTDYVGAGTTFIAISGSKSDGLNFVSLALQKGATTIVIQEGVKIPEELEAMILDYGASVVRVLSTRKSLSEMAAKALDYPAKKLKIVAVTGTKGKTSTAYMAYFMLCNLGKKVALISTVEKRINLDYVSMPLTTPLPDQIHIFLDECVKRDVEFVIMEVSAQALTLDRVEGIEFDVGIFTNFSHEHLEFYENLEQYFLAKKLLLSKIKNPANMFVNIDDKHGAGLVLQHSTYSSFSLFDDEASIYYDKRNISSVHIEKDQTFLSVSVYGKKYDFLMPLIGDFNIYNLLGVVGALSALGINLQDCKNGLKNLPHVPGRMEQYKLQNGAQCIIDYAHNPSSFEAVLSTLRAMTSHLIVVFGAAGNRDKQKRPIMGMIAQEYCDVVILTSDNPRDESPDEIAKDVEVGFIKNTRVKLYKELNRVKAIEFGCEITTSGSIVAILGKGRDEYQIVGGLTFPFKERSIIKPFLADDDAS